MSEPVLEKRNERVLYRGMRMNRRPKRFGAHPVESGPFEGALHVSTRRFRRFRGELLVLENHLDSWLLPQDPEEVRMTRIILMLQNVLEHMTEFAIYAVASRSSNPEDRQFHNSIIEGYRSFKSKFEWLFNKGLITETHKNVMDEIRKIRNEQVHSRPSSKRQKLTYFDTALLTRKAIEQMLLDVQPLVEKLGRISGVTAPSVIPPRFFDEDEWESP
jgi:Domain of unknown function (DUF4145)